MSYVLGRNCRFLQGPKTNPFSVARIKEKLAAGKEHCETFLNYRRDGSPFMNLLMVAPLYDSRGVVRYHIGAQVDVSGLVKECAGLESLGRVIERDNVEQRQTIFTNGHRQQQVGKKDTQTDEFRNLAEMFSLQELKTVREAGGNMHRVRQGDISETEGVSNWHKPRLMISDEGSVERRDSDPVLHSTAAAHAAAAPAPTTAAAFTTGLHSTLPSSGKLSGVYEHYLLVRPFPSLRILFASPSLRVPGMLQSSLMARVGGSARTRDALTQAFADGQGVTAKVRWITRADPEGRGRWIHCTPLQGSNGAVGVWMVVLVDDEADYGRGPRDAPPVEKFVHHRRTPAEIEDTMSLSSFQAAHGGSGRVNHYHGPNGAAHGEREAPGTPDTYRFESL
jgi:hypothetical protein